MFHKKGETESNIELWFLIIALAFGAILGLDLLKETTDRLTGNDLKKKLIAREIALVIDSAYAASQKFEYEYSLPPEHNFCVTVNEEESRVEVRSTQDSAEIPYAYRIVQLDLSDSGSGTRDISKVSSDDLGGVLCADRCKGEKTTIYKITKKALKYSLDKNKLIPEHITLSSECKP